MTVQEFWNSGIQLFNLCAVYYVVQIVRCVQISFIVFALIFTLRKTILKNKVFLKGALWSLFIPVLFIGKMKFFYENSIGIKLFSWLTAICMSHTWICWIYLCGVLIYAALLLYRRNKLKKMVADMEKRKVDGTVIYVAKIPITPSTIGVFRPKIVMPEVILKEYDRKEFKTILLHEMTHIRLGHLLFYLLWDMLRALLWFNPFLAIGTKYFREDMEEICDWVTIKRSEGKAYDYGQLLLKSMRVLQAESEDFNMYANFVGDKEYQNIRQRVTRIAQYKPYNWIVAVSTFVASILCAIGTVIWVQSISYDKYNEDESILVYQYDSENITLLDNDNSLNQMIFFDDSYVYIDRKSFESFLHKNNATGEIYIVFGGFYKLPGFVSVGFSCCYEPGLEDNEVKIPYEKPMNDWKIKLLKML